MPLPLEWEEEPPSPLPLEWEEALPLQLPLAAQGRVQALPLAGAAAVLRQQPWGALPLALQQQRACPSSQLVPLGWLQAL